jgi:hypothetical protein
VNDPLLIDLHSLLHETDLLIANPAPSVDQLNSYSQWRQEIFSRLQGSKEVLAREASESLREVLLRIHAQNDVLLQQLERHRFDCGKELLSVARARQAVNERSPTFTGRLLERHI